MLNTDSILYVVKLPCALLQTGHLETVHAPALSPQFVKSGVNCQFRKR